MFDQYSSLEQMIGLVSLQGGGAFIDVLGRDDAAGYTKGVSYIVNKRVHSRQ